MVNMIYLRQRREFSLYGLKWPILTLKTKNVQDSRKKIEDQDLEALLDEDRCQILEQLSDTLNVTETAVSKRLLGLV